MHFWQNSGLLAQKSVFGTALMGMIFFHLTLLWYQNIKTSLCTLFKNVWVMPFFITFRSARKKLHVTVFFDHPVFVSVHLCSGELVLLIRLRGYQSLLTLPPSLPKLDYRQASTNRTAALTLTWIEIWTNTIYNLDKYNWQFGQMQLTKWTNTIDNWRNTLHNLDKYNLQ